MKNVGIVGLGYVGLPLAVQAAEKGCKVCGVDLDSELVNKINNRISPFVNDARFDDAFEKVSSDSLTASIDYKNLVDADVVVICVPTPTNNNVPDLALVKSAATSVASILKKDQLILLESTVNPTVTRNVVLGILESISGLKVGKDFYLAYCPERIDPGNQHYFVGNINRVVGGITEICTERAYDFYSSIIDADIMKLDSPEEAEFVKSWENTHRNVMIALANTSALICDAVGMNVDNVLKGLQTKVDQFGLHLAKPGIGPGGHCIPEDIHYVIKNSRENGLDARFLNDAAEVNERMPNYAIYKLSEMIEKNGERLENLNVLLLGVAYKPNVADTRRSPAIELGYALVRKSKKLMVHDSCVALGESIIKGAEIVLDLKAGLATADIVVIGCAHKEYSAKGLIENSCSNIRYVYDGRNCLDAENIRSQNILYKGVGR